MFKVSVIAFTLFALAAAKDNFADSNVADNVVDDRKVSEAFKDDNVDTPILEIIALHIGTHDDLILTAKEAVGIAGKIRNRDLLEKDVLKDTLVKIMDLADQYKRKLESCSVTKGRGVDNFIRPDLSTEIKKRLLLLHDSFRCPDNQELVDEKDNGQQNKSQFPFDWDMVEKLKAKLTTQPNTLLTDVITYAQSTGYVGKETLPVVTMIATEILKNSDVIDFALASIEQFEMLFETESGQRLMNFVPSVMNKDPTEIIQLFQEEADNNQDVFFTVLGNEDLSNQFMKQAARFILTAVQWARTALEDQMKFAIFNTVLISNDFPPINKRQLLKSTCAIIEKCMRMFTTVQLEAVLYDEIKVLTDEFERIYFKFDDFDKLNEDELVNMVSKFMHENLLAQFKDLYLANKQVTQVNKNCAEMTLCLLNEKYGKKNKIVQTMVKGSSITMLYSWNYLYPDMEMQKNYVAVFQGMAASAGDITCKEAYPHAPRNCDAFENNELEMKLNYDHNEL